MINIIKEKVLFQDKISLLLFLKLIRIIHIFSYTSLCAYHNNINYIYLINHLNVRVQ